MFDLPINFFEKKYSTLRKSADTAFVGCDLKLVLNI